MLFPAAELLEKRGVTISVFHSPVAGGASPGLGFPVLCGCPLLSPGFLIPFQRPRTLIMELTRSLLPSSCDLPGVGDTNGSAIVSSIDVQEDSMLGQYIPPALL